MNKLKKYVKDNKLIFNTVSILLGLVFLMLVGIPLFNSGMRWIIKIVPDQYMTFVLVAMLIVFSLLGALLFLKKINPKIKELSANSFDRPSLAVIISGSSGLGIYRAFKNVKDERFTSVIKGFLFDVNEKTEKQEIEGSIQAFKFPVEPAQEGYAGAKGARILEKDRAIQAFKKFYKPFAKKFTAAVRITGIGEGFTSITASSEFDFVDMKSFGKNGPKNLTIFDFVLTNGLVSKNKLKRRFIKFKKNIFEFKNLEGDTIQNGMYFPDKKLLIAPYSGLKKLINSDEYKISATNNNGIEVQDLSKNLEYSTDGKIIWFSGINSEDFIEWDLYDQEQEKTKGISTSNVDNKNVMTAYQFNSEFREDKSVVLAEKNDFIYSDRAFKKQMVGSPLMSEDGKLLGMNLATLDNNNLTMKIEKIHMLIDEYEKEKLTIKNLK